MLRHLYIKNFTLIDLLDTDFHSGYTVITGETGAGKSIILGAIALLLGGRADTRRIKTGEKKCVIEATFTTPDDTLATFYEANDIEADDECVIRREVSASGKSRAFVNDTPVALPVVRALGEMLIDIHSQHQNLLLQKADFMLGVVDILADNREEREAYQQTYREQSGLKTRLDTRRREAEEARANEEFLRYQYRELEAAHLAEGEQETLEQESEAMEHAEEIKSALYEAHGLMDEGERSVLTAMRTVVTRLQAIAKPYPAAAELSRRMDEAYIEVKDIAAEVAGAMDTVEFSPERLAAVSEKLDTLYTLQQKHHAASEAELIALRDSIGRQIDQIDNSEEDIAALDAQYQAALAACQERAQALTATRQGAAHTLERALAERLAPLGMPNVQFQTVVSPAPLSAAGADSVQFLFTANKNTPLQPIGQIASGGEIARVMLALKALISGAVKLPTIIFDEIDTGVSGRVAEKMAQMMHEMGRKDRQVICITHLPQIAAEGDTHYKVSKEDREDATVSTMRMLTPEERIGEIAMMLSGSDITAAAIENAKNLLQTTHDRQEL